MPTIQTASASIPMIHYHGVAGGMPKIDKARFLQGRHAMISHDRPEDIEVAMDVCQSVVFDNGAYAVWRRGGQIDYDEYVQWVRKWHRHPRFDWAVIPDVINGNEEENDEWVDRWPCDLTGAPVWHPHESIDRLFRLSSEWGTVAIGGSDKYPTPGSNIWWMRISEAMDAICDDEGRPYCRLHGLRMLDPKIFTKLPLASADSINAGRRGNSMDRFGMYPPPTAAQRADVVAERIESHSSAATWTRVDQHDLFQPTNAHA